MRRAVARLLALAVAFAAVLGAAAAPAQATLKMIWGPNTMPDGTTSAFPTYQRLGVDVLQRQLRWSSVAVARPAIADDPNDPAYVWPVELDVAVREAAAHRMSVALQVSGSPTWANGGRTPGHAPADPRDYAAFLKAASRRYPSVRHWMIWGEPTRPGNFRPMSRRSARGTRRYAALLDRAYGAVKSVDRRDKVVGGNTWTLGVVPPPRFIRWLRLPNGKPPRLDFWGHNPFGRRKPDLSDDPYFAGLRDFNDLDTLAREVRRAYRKRGRAPKLWAAEWTISSSRANRAYDFFVSRRTQARWITAAFRELRRARYVHALGWYSLLDEDPSIPRSLTTGLMTYDGRPKPAFRAYARAR